MKVICKYSGIPFAVQNFRNTLLRDGIHPIFTVSQKELIDLVRNDSWSSRDETEQRLLFIALFKATGVVDFRTAARPSIKTVSKWMEALIKTTEWKYSYGDNVPLPGFRVTRDTYTLGHIGGWLNICNERKFDWDNKSDQERRSDSIRRMEERINNRLRRGYADKRKLISYAMMVANVPSAIQPLWTDLFLLDPSKAEDKPKIWNANLQDFKDMYQCMVENIEAYTLMGGTILDHCRRLISVNSLGMEWSIMDMPADMQQDFMEQVKTFNDSPYAIVRRGDNIVEFKGGPAGKLPNLSEVLSHIPTPEELAEEEFIFSVAPETRPAPGDYPTRVAFLKAEAKWLVAERKARELTEKAIERRKARLSIDTNYVLGEDDSLSSPIDPMEITEIRGAKEGDTGNE